ncbi:MAG: YhjD/YihY/BrkB family envelope integrity protein [Eikenella corrodens]
MNCTADTPRLPKPAFISGIITVLLCYLLKVAFTWLQSSITKYNAIYGSLALVPIFLTRQE